MSSETALYLKKGVLTEEKLRAPACPLFRLPSYICMHFVRAECREEYPLSSAQIESQEHVLLVTAFVNALLKLAVRTTLLLQTYRFLLCTDSHGYPESTNAARTTFESETRVVISREMLFPTFNHSNRMIERLEGRLNAPFFACSGGGGWLGRAAAVVVCVQTMHARPINECNRTGHHESSGGCTSTCRIQHCSLWCWCRHCHRWRCHSCPQRNFFAAPSYCRHDWWHLYSR